MYVNRSNPLVLETVPQALDDFASQIHFCLEGNLIRQATLYLPLCQFMYLDRGNDRIQLRVADTMTKYDYMAWFHSPYQIVTNGRIQEFSDLSAERVEEVKNCIAAICAKLYEKA